MIVERARGSSSAAAVHHTVVLAIRAPKIVIALEERLRRRFDIVRHAESHPGSTLWGLCCKVSPCVIVIDEQLYEKEITGHGDGVGPWPGGVQVVVRYKRWNEQRAVELLSQGCDGLISANADPDIAAKAVQRVAEGELWASRRLVSHLCKTLRTGWKPQLTSREVEIWRCIGSGLKNREIAEQLFISISTVRWHIRGLCRKLGARDRQQVTRRWAISQSADGSGPRSPANHFDARGTASLRPNGEGGDGSPPRE